MSRIRPNVSPSMSKQRPIKAVRAFSLISSSSSTSRSSNSSPRGKEGLRSLRKSPENRSPERRSPVSPTPKEKSKQHLTPNQLLSVSWRASSADPFVPSYLTGHWPKEVSSCHHYANGGLFMCDKSTQTVGAWEQIAEKKKNHRRSASFGQGDLSKELIKQRLHKSKEGSRHESGKLRLSPLTGIHSTSLSLTAPPAFFAHIKRSFLSLNPYISIRQNMNRFQRNSVEGLNVEIEKLVLSKPGSTSAGSQELEEVDIFRAQDIPDGHRAPIPEVTHLSCTRSVDTQTPSAQVDGCPQSASSTSLSASASGQVSIFRPDSVSPASHVPASGHISTDLLHPESRSDSMESKSSKGDSEFGSPEPSKFFSSPKPDKSCPFVRQPPDGCEKIKVIEETRRPAIKEPLFCPVKTNQFVFKPSQGSAFSPLKHYLGGEMGDLQVLRSTPGPHPMPAVSGLNQSPTIEGQ